MTLYKTAFENIFNATIYSFVHPWTSRFAMATLLGSVWLVPTMSGCESWFVPETVGMVLDPQRARGTLYLLGTKKKKTQKNLQGVEAKIQSPRNKEERNVRCWNTDTRWKILNFQRKRGAHGHRTTWVWFKTSFFCLHPHENPKHIVKHCQQHDKKILLSFLWKSHRVFKVNTHKRSAQVSPKTWTHWQHVPGCRSVWRSKDWSVLLCICLSTFRESHTNCMCKHAKRLDRNFKSSSMLTSPATKDWAHSLISNKTD